MADFKLISENERGKYMENNENIKASFKGLVPFIVFILLYLGTGIFLNIKGVELAFYQLPGPVAAFAGIIVAFIIFRNYTRKI